MDAAEIMRFRPDEPPSNRLANQVLWLAPGSAHKAQLAITQHWPQADDLSELVTIPGPWGAVLWDSKRERYCVATDSIGVQPVFWAETTHGDVVVGSWLAQVVDQPDVSEELDYEGILLTSVPLSLIDEVRHRTRFAAVQLVPWGSARTFPRDGRGAYVRYWDPSQVPESDVSLDEAAVLLRYAVGAAVERSLEGGEATGAHISGGLDCSAVALKAQQLLEVRGQSLVAGYSWSPSPDAFGPVAGDERPRVLAVARAAGVPMRWVDDDSSGDWYFDRDVNRYPHNTQRWERSVLPQAREDGVKVMLSGWGGDEVASFNGRNAISSALRRGRLWQAWSMAGANPFRGQGTDRWSGGRVLLRAIRSSVSSGDQPAMRDSVESACALLRPASPLAADALMEGWQRQLDLPTVRSAQLLLLTDGHLQERMMAWYQTGRLFDVHYRFPLLDHEVVTTALGLPPFAFYYQGVTRAAFRRAVSPWTPEIVVANRPKFEPAMLHPESPRRVRSPQRPGGSDQASAAMLSLAAQVHQLLMAAGTQ